MSYHKVGLIRGTGVKLLFAYTNNTTIYEDDSAMATSDIINGMN